MTETPVTRVALLLFGSGLCALIYQVAWLRELRLVFGGSTAASAAVLAVFMGGLGAGGLLLGKRAAAAPRPLALYGRLELGIALSSALTPLAVALARRLYAAVGGTPALGLGGGTVARLVLAAVVLGLPTVLMGGTLPAAAQAVARRGDVGRRDLAVLYGANTLGAVAGTALSTFVLLEVLGTHRMLLGACAFNVLVALIALLMAGRRTDRAPAPELPEAPLPAAAPPRFVLAAAAVVGFAFLLMELVWYRMLAPLLGGSSFTFGLILAVALLGIGAGGIAYALGFGAGSGRRPPTLSGFALTCGFEALAMAIPLALGDRVALWAATLRPLGSVGFYGYVAGWTAIAAVVVLPAAFISGLQFPLLIALYGHGRPDVGRQIGHAYAWNTAGAIAGSLGGGFGLMPLLTAPGCWRAAAALLAALGLVAVALSRRWHPRQLVTPVLVAGLALVLLTRPGPSAAWRHGSVGVGRAPSSGTPNTLQDWVNRHRRHVRWEVDGVESSVGLYSGSALAFIVNGKPDGNARGDAPTQVMAGLTAALVHPAVHRSLVVGLGTGSTAGWLGRVPTMERVDVVELEPAILEVARRCAPVNQNVLENPRVHITIGDAREVVATTRARYDLIFSEPSNPYRAGVASLFTQEFYRAAAARLASDGLFAQWLQAYSVDAQTIRTIYATMASVFPEVETWISQGADLLLIAGKRRLIHDVPTLRARIATEPWRTALARVWRVEDLEGVFARYVADADLARAVARLEGDRLNTDDMTRVEFGFARGLGFRSHQFDVSDLRAVAAREHFDRPLLAGGTLDWGKVNDHAVAMQGVDGSTPLTLPDDAPAALDQRNEAIQHWSDGDLAEALTAWRAQRDEPVDSIAVGLMAESLADDGDATAERYIERLRPWHQVEADAHLARLRFNQHRIVDAVEALDRAFAGAATDPWPLTAVLERALDLAVEIGGADRAAAQHLLRRLGRPLAISLVTDHREQTVVTLAESIDWPHLCEEALAPLEPHIPWNDELLARRVRCYEANHDPRLPRARADLARYQSREPLPFASGLTAPPH
jgi:spermidine synthase